MDLDLAWYVAGLIGTRYVWWTADMPDCGPMAYASNDKSVPNEIEVKITGMNCVGLINLMRRFKGLDVPGVKEQEKYAGGTYVWFNYLLERDLLKSYIEEETYPLGTLLLRPYTNEQDQGHVAVVCANNKVLHCYPQAGLCIENFAWKDYYTHVCAPADWL